MLGLSFLYFIAGVIAAFVFRRRVRRVALVIPFLSTLFGGIAGFAEGSLYSVVIALIYRSDDFTMPWYMAIVWGLGLSLFYLILSLFRIFTQW